MLFVLQDNKVPQVHLERLDHAELLEVLESRVLRENRVQEARMVSKEAEVLLESGDFRVRRDRLVRRDLPDQEVPLGPEENR